MNTKNIKKIGFFSLLVLSANLYTTEADNIMQKINNTNVTTFVKPNLLTLRMSINDKNEWYGVLTLVNKFASNQDLASIKSSLTDISNAIFTNLSIIYGSYIAPTLKNDAKQDGFKLSRDFVDGLEKYKNNPAALKEIENNIAKAKNAINDPKKFKANLNSINTMLKEKLQPELQKIRKTKDTITKSIIAEESRWWPNKQKIEQLKVLELLALVLEINLEKITSYDYITLEKFVNKSL